MRKVKKETFQQNLTDGDDKILIVCDYIFKFLDTNDCTKIREIIKTDAKNIFDNFMIKVRSNKRRKIDSSEGDSFKITTYGEKSIPSLATACVFLAMQQNTNKCCTLRKFVNLLEKTDNMIKKDKVFNFIKKIYKELDLITPFKSIKDITMYMLSVLQKKNMISDNMQIEKVYDLVEKLENRLEGKRPGTIAAAAIYIASGGKIDKCILGKLGFCAVSTINNTLRIIKEGK